MDNTIKSISKTWQGGEHRLAGERASELVYGSSNSADQGVLAKLMEAAPGIERYITAPTAKPVTQVSDQGGDPQAVQPENRKESAGASNVSSEQAKDEQDKIDDDLAPGREAREEAGNAIEATQLNPPASDDANIPAKLPEPVDQPTEPKATRRKAAPKKSAKAS